MEYKTIQYETVEKGIMQLSLNRPESYNAITHLMMEELEDFWRQRLYDLDTVIVLMKGNGEKGFCAGLDMKESMETAPKMSTEEFYRFQARLARINLHMRRAPQPIITTVHGAAAGQGFSLVLSSDIRIISPDAKFSARIYKHRPWRSGHGLQLSPAEDDRSGESL
jgi:enoyl-CoA hydratase/carnithine racemase